MNKKRLIVILLLAAVATSALAIGNTIAQKTNHPDQNQSTVTSPSGLKPKPADLDREMPSQPAQVNPLAGQPTPPPAAEDVPEDIVYGQVFRHLKELRRKADDEERQGRAGVRFRQLYRQMAKLNDRQAMLLDEVAADTDREIEKLNRRAIDIIREVRAKHPEGKLATDERPPAPPAELAQLSAARRDLLMQARERLRSVFGEEEFRRFNRFVQGRVKPGIRRLDQAGAPPSAPQGR